MASDSESSSKRTADGFVLYSNGAEEQGLPTHSVVDSSKPLNHDGYDVIIIGAGFAGLIAARELSLRGRSVLILEARDRIGGRTFTAQLDERKFEIGGTWIHWSQPHVWTEVTRYGLSLTESKGATADRMSILLDNGTRLKEGSAAECWTEMAKGMENYSNVDGVHGRSVIPLPHAPFAADEAVRKYDQLSMKDRLDQLVKSHGINEEMYQILSSFLCMNVQGDIATGGFIDHLRWWALGDHEMTLLFDKLGRYKIKEGTTALARAMLNDCRNVTLLLSTPIVSLDRTSGNSVLIRTQSGQLVTGRSVIVTVPMNALKSIEFLPPLAAKKREAVAEGQCRGGSKFWAKLEKPVGNWFGFAPYPNPISMAYTDDQEGNIIVGFGPDDTLNIRSVQVVEKELSKMIPNVKVQCVLGHDWRSDPYVLGTWSWYKPGQMSSSLVEFQKAEAPVFFASGDIANGWRGFIDGALESGLTSARDVQQYLGK